MENRIKVRIRGKNIERFLRYLYQSKIVLYEEVVIYPKEVMVVIGASDLKNVERLGKRYEMEVISYFGLLRLECWLKKYYLFLFVLSFGVLLLMMLSNMVFKVEVLHSSKWVRNMIEHELRQYDVVKYAFKKDYKTLLRIKKKILEAYPDKIEWLEIEEVGTHYIVRVEERKRVLQEKKSMPMHIIAKKSAIIIRVDATKGMILKTKNDYVKKGDIVISGEIKHGDAIVDNVKAEGVVYGEVWYNIKVELPLHKTIRMYTGRKKKVLVAKLLHYKWNVFEWGAYEDKEVHNIPLVQNRLVPLGLSMESQKEIKIAKKNYTKKEAIKEAEKIAILKMKQQLEEGEWIIRHHVLSVVEEKGHLYLTVFMKVCENITDVLLIKREG